MDTTEEIRHFYKPAKVNLLFVAESPPKGGTFFYCENSNLYFAVKEAFSQVFEGCNDNQFLEFFKNKGCYLDDLCLIPVNGLSKSEREDERFKGIEPLAQRITELKPQAVIVLMKGIETSVRKAIQESAIGTLKFIKVTSFPAHSEKNRLNCIEGVCSALKESIKMKIIKNAT